MWMIRVDGRTLVMRIAGSTAEGNERAVSVELSAERAEELGNRLIIAAQSRRAGESMTARPARGIREPNTITNVKWPVIGRTP